MNGDQLKLIRINTLIQKYLDEAKSDIPVMYITEYVHGVWQGKFELSYEIQKILDD